MFGLVALSTLAVLQASDDLQQTMPETVEPPTQVEPVTADCVLVGDVDGTVLNNPNLRCPADVIDANALQAYAITLAEQLPRSTELRSWRPVTIAEDVTFEYRNGSWLLPTPTRLISSQPRYPALLAQRGQIARCDIRVLFTQGVVEPTHEIICQAFRGRNLRPTRSSSQLVESAEAVLEKTIWLADPVRGSSCTTTYFQYWLGGDVEDRPAAGPVLDTPLPDAPTCPEQ